MKPILPAFVVLSAFRGEYDLQHNLARHASLGEWLRDRGIGIKSLVGRYKDEQEASWLAVLPTDYASALDEIRRIAFALCSQESILVVDPDRACTLHYADGEVEAIGQFKAVTKAVADRHSGASYDPSQDQWYVCA